MTTLPVITRTISIFFSVLVFLRAKYDIFPTNRELHCAAMTALWQSKLHVEAQFLISTNLQQQQKDLWVHTGPHADKENTLLEMQTRITAETQSNYAPVFDVAL